MDWAQIFESTLRAAVGRDMIVYALAAIGLNIHFGYTGLLNFGQAGFLAVGGYGTAVSVHEFGLPLWLAAGVGLLCGVLFALVLGVPTLRLRADYLAIVTIAAAEIFRRLMAVPNFQETTGGSDGLNNFADGFFDANPIPDGTYGFGPWEYDERQLWYHLVGWGMVLLAVLVTFLLMRSPWGRVVRAIREDEDAVRSLGKNVFSYKMQSLVLGGVIGCLGGFVYGLAYGSVQPDVFGTETTFFLYTMVILGGAARVFGPVIGAMLFWVLLVLLNGTLSEAVAAGVITFIDTSQAGALRFVFVGLGLILLLVFRPQGIFGDKREIAIDAR
jgi:neutral amino acid transport system permease protein